MLVEENVGGITVLEFGNVKKLFNVVAMFI